MPVRLGGNPINGAIGTAPLGGIALGETRIWPETHVPDPVAHFDFHEGTGSTTTSLVGGYTMTAANPGTAWDGPGSAKGEFSGTIGPSVAHNAWSAAYEVTVQSSWPGSVQSFGYHPTVGGGSVWLNLNASTGVPGIWPPDQFGSTALPPGAYTVAWALSPASVETYVNGVLSGSLSIPFTDAYSINWALAATHLLVPSNCRIHSMRTWDVTLTADEAAAL